MVNNNYYMTQLCNIKVNFAYRCRLLSISQIKVNTCNSHQIINTSMKIDTVLKMLCDSSLLVIMTCRKSTKSWSRNTNTLDVLHWFHQFSLLVNSPLKSTKNVTDVLDARSDWSFTFLGLNKDGT